MVKCFSGIHKANMSAETQVEVMYSIDSLMVYGLAIVLVLLLARFCDCLPCADDVTLSINPLLLRRLKAPAADRYDMDDSGSEHSESVVKDERERASNIGDSTSILIPSAAQL